MGQNNDNTEHGDLQGQQGVIKSHPKSAYLGAPDREGNNVFRERSAAPQAARPNADGEDAPNAIPLPGEK